MDSATSGSVIIDGKDISKFKPKELTKYRREDIGFVFQFYNLVQNLTAIENVELATQICKHPLDPKDILEKVYRKLKRITFRENISNDLYQISINNLRKFEIPEISLDEQKYILRQEMKINKKIQEFEKKKQELYNI